MTFTTRHAMTDHAATLAAALRDCAATTSRVTAMMPHNPQVARQLAAARAALAAYDAEQEDRP